MIARVDGQRTTGWAVVTGILVVLVLLLTACSGSGEAPAAEGPPDESSALEPVQLATGEPLRVLATTSIVADVAAAVGGDRVAVTALVPRGVDPHAFEPTPQDVIEVSNAHVIVANGFGLEAFLEDLLTNAGGHLPVVYVSDGIDPLEGHEQEGEADEVAEGEVGDHHDHGEYDPHTWMDPRGVMVWVGNLQAALTSLDPDGQATYARNAQAYLDQLEQLDAEVEALLAPLPPASRQLVTDHEEFAYFARRYEFTIVGAVIPSPSSAAEPSAQALAVLETAIRQTGVRAVFVSSVVSPDLARQVAEDTGIQLVTLNAHSLTDDAGPAPTYLAMMRANARLIAEALGG